MDSVTWGVAVSCHYTASYIATEFVCAHSLANNYCRCITEFMDDFHHERKQIKRHIPCKFAKEMSTRSVVVNNN